MFTMGTLRNYILTVFAVIYLNLGESTGQAPSLLVLSSKPEVQTSKSLLDVLTSRTSLQVHIKGGDIRTSRINDGLQVFEAAETRDPDMPTARIFYSWSSVMYNSAGENKGSCIKPGSPRNDRKLTIDPSRLSVNTTCTITLTATSATKKSGSGTVTLIINASDPPKCFMETKRPEVKPGDRTTLTVTCTSVAKVRDVVWMSPSTEGTPGLDVASAVEDQYTDTLPDSVYKNTIVLRKGVLKAGTKYRIEATVTDVKGDRTTNQITLRVMDDIPEGEMSCPSYYTELEPITISLTKTDGLSPLTYVLLVQTSPGKYKAVSGKQNTGTFTITGPHAYGFTNNVFIAEICGQESNDFCTMKRCKVPTVMPSRNVKSVANILMKQVDILRKQGRPLEAAVLLSTLYEKTKDNSLISQMLKTTEDALDGKIMNDNSASTILDVLTNIPPKQLSEQQVSSITTFMTTATDFFINRNVKIPERFVSALDLWVVRAEAAGLSDRDVRTVAEKAVVAESSGLEYGNSNTHDLETSRVTSFNDIPGDSVKCQDADDNDIHIIFGSSVRDKVGHKNLKFKVRAYKNHPKHIQETLTSAMAPVVDMSFFDPTTHAEEHVSDLAKPVSVYFTLKDEHKDSHVPAQCVYWCPTRHAWITDGVTTGVQKSTRVECKTSHFSTYTVVHAHQAYNKDHNVAWIVGTVLSVIIAMILIILLIIYIAFKAKRRRVNDSSRSHSRLAESPTDERKRDDRRDNGRRDDGRGDERDELTRYDSPAGRGQWGENRNGNPNDQRPGSGDGLKRGVD